MLIRNQKYLANDLIQQKMYNHCIEAGNKKINFSQYKQIFMSILTCVENAHKRTHVRNTTSLILELKTIVMKKLKMNCKPFITKTKQKLKLLERQ